MSVMFGRFDYAPEPVREAVIALSAEGSASEGQDYERAASVIRDHALPLFPNATVSDLAHTVSVLAQEAKQLGHLGRYCQSHKTRARFEWAIRSLSPSGIPWDDLRFMTLAEIDVLKRGPKQRAGEAR